MWFELLFAAALALVTAVGGSWLVRHDQPGDQLAPMVGFASGLAAVVWLYAVLGSASAGTWSVEAPSGLATALGALIGVPSAAVLVVAVAQLRAAADDRLVTTGLYRRFRHPQIMGLVGLLSGVAIAGRSGFALLLAALLALLGWRMAAHEDRRLAEHWGDDYPSYRARTPGITSRRRPERH